MSEFTSFRCINHERMCAVIIFNFAPLRDRDQRNRAWNNQRKLTGNNTWLQKIQPRKSLIALNILSLDSSESFKNYSEQKWLANNFKNKKKDDKDKVMERPIEAQ